MRSPRNAGSKNREPKIKLWKAEEPAKGTEAGPQEGQKENQGSGTTDIKGRKFLNKGSRPKICQSMPKINKDGIITVDLILLELPVYKPRSSARLSSGTVSYSSPYPSRVPQTLVFNTWLA